METLPESLLRLTHNLPNGVGDIQEISEADYKAKRPHLPPIVGGQWAVSLNEIEFVSGNRLWLEVSIQAASNEMRERQLVKHVFEGPHLVCRRIDGGVSIWNRARIVSYSFSQGLEVPMPALPAELLS